MYIKKVVPILVDLYTLCTAQKQNKSRTKFCNPLPEMIGEMFSNRTQNNTDIPSIKHLVLGALLAYVGSIDPQTVCTQLLSLDCNNYTPLENDESICGTDGVHYDN